MKFVSLLFTSAVLLQITTATEVFITEPEDVAVPVGSLATVSFTCKVDSSNPVYTWMKDKKTLDLAANSRLATFGGTLQISQPQQSDAGAYRCVSTSNDGKVVSNSANLVFESVGDFPTTKPTSVTVVQGEGVKIECPPISFAPDNSVALYWEREEEFEMINRPGSNSRYISWAGDLYIATSQRSDADSYVCRARTLWDDESGKPVERRSESTQLSVVRAVVSAVAPKMVLKPEDTTTAKLGGPMLLECFAYGNPVPEISWTKNGVEVPITDLSEGHQVFIRNVAEDDVGTYECTAENSNGMDVASTNVVLNYAPKITQHLLAQDLELSGMGQLSCGFTAQPAPTAITWIKDAQIIQADSRMTIESSMTSSELHIKDLNEDDSGIYQCLVENSLGDVLTSAKIEVSAVAPGFITDMPDVQQVASGTSVEVKCDIQASPKAQVSWTKDEFDMIQPYGDEGYSLGDNGYNLIIDNVADMDEGAYKCSASNLAGSIDGTTYLQVFEPTVITKFPVNQEVLVGDAPSLICAATYDASFTPDWVWTRDGGVLVEKVEEESDADYVIQGGALTIKNIGTEQSGVYQCCIKTTVGTECASATVTVNGPPGAITSVSVEPMSGGEHMMLSWMEPATNGAEIDEYTIDYCRVTTDGSCSASGAWMPATTSPSYLNVTSGHVVDLLPYNFYKFRVSSSNKFGDSQISLATLPKRTSAAAPIASPANVGGGGGFVGQLVVTWEPLQRSYYGDDAVDYDVFIRRQVEGNDTEPWTAEFVAGGDSNEVVFRVSNEEIYTAYDVKVRATNNQGAGPFSEIETVHTAELAPVEIPSEFQVEKRYSYSAKISWKRVEDNNGFTQGYHVSVCDLFKYKNCNDPDTWINIQTMSPEPFVIIEDLSPNQPYKMRAAAYNSAGAGPFSNFTDEFVTAKRPPQRAPNNVKYTLQGQKLSAEWDTVTSESGEGKVKGYVLQYWYAGKETIADARQHFTSSPSSTHATITLPGSADFSVCVAAYSDGGNGKPSAVKVISTNAGISSKYTGAATSVSSNIFTLLTAAFLAFMMKLAR